MKFRLIHLSMKNALWLRVLSCVQLIPHEITDIQIHSSWIDKSPMSPNGILNVDFFIFEAYKIF